ncbi:MAG: ribonuclease R [Nitrospinae bacterium]|nr:ribonuclease R [Nitrospinota bacterium]
MDKNAQLLELVKKILDRPLTPPEIRRRLPKEFRPGLSQKLHAFENSGEIVKIRYGRYGLASQMNLVTGRVQGHGEGFGFLLPETEGAQDVFLGPSNFREAMHGDRVVCRVEGSRRDGKPEGRVIRILERANKTVTGVYQSKGKGGVIAPTQKRISQDFSVRPGKTMQAKSGQVVVGTITQYPEEHQFPEAEVLEVLGFPDDPAVQKSIIIRQYELQEEFPPPALRIAEKIAEPGEKDFKGRLDLRAEWIITIDGEDAKDFDDAVSIRRTRTGYELGVHIADVSNYVHEDNPLDKAAYARGTSTYFPGSVIPMLPFNLSNNVCSLVPHVERLTLSAIIRLNQAAEIENYRFTTSVIKSVHRMTYTGAAKVINDPSAEPDSLKKENLLLMNELAKKMYANRLRAGGLNFDLPEPKIILDLQGEPSDIIRAERNDAHKLIEEFMLTANRCAANYLADAPALYRIHPAPDRFALDEFFEFAQRLGYATNPKLEAPFRLQELLKKAEGHPDEQLLNFVMLRHMKQASYSPENIGHFGLSFAEYTHFTSPIRRYPDLIVHRLIKQKLAGERRYLDLNQLGEAGAHCSHRERTSEKAERDVVQMLKVRYMADREGDEFDGVITGVTAFGVFVEMEGVMVEGLLRLTDLHDDYYEYHEKEHMLMGKRTRKIFRLGHPMKVRIKLVDVTKKEITLEPASAPKERRPSVGGGKKEFGRKKGGRGRGRR